MDIDAIAMRVAFNSLMIANEEFKTAYDLIKFLGSHGWRVGNDGEGKQKASKQFGRFWVTITDESDKYAEDFRIHTAVVQKSAN